jgi:two-component system nitrate/nitrite sensor histidine kinase NarX
MDNKGLIPAIIKLIDKFKRESDIIVFFQNEWQEQKLKSEHEYQVIRIIQESLNNIKKHSHARTVRLMLKTHATYNEILIEDDGVGINNSNVESTSLGEHIGLSVMKERAQRTGGSLTIESEIDEGTQILFNFPTINSLQQPVNFMYQ